MRWQSYPNYKNSDIDWLGEIPEHWKTVRAKHCSKINMGQSPNSDDCNLDGIGLPFLQGNAEFDQLNPLPKQYCNVARKIAYKGDFLISVRAPVGALNLADQSYGIGRGLCGITANNDHINSSFCWYLLNHVRVQLDSCATGSTYDAVSAHDVSNIIFVIPHIDEQQAIAAFLDRKTKRIDELIAKKERQIELLQEKRAALISHCVTKGLNPNVKMKDSGVERLGEIPEHWIRIRAKHACSIFVPQRNKPELNTYSDGIPWITMDDLNNKDIHKSNVGYYVNKYEAKSKGSRVLPKYSVIASCVGNFGISGVNSQPIIINQQLQAYIPFKVNHWFLYYFTIISKSYFEKVATTSTLPYVNQEGFGNITITMPDIEEQEKIVNYLDEETRKLDKLSCTVTEAIELLQEYRTALISAAVTGKINVTGEKM